MNSKCVRLRKSLREYKRNSLQDRNEFFLAFFDIMIHLILHLLEEAIFGGPVYMRWMYLFKQFLKKFKEYVRNQTRVEGSIVEGYVIDEALTFCFMYLEGIETKFNRPDRNSNNTTSTQSKFLVFQLGSCIS